MRTLLRHQLSSGVVNALYTEVDDGDFGIHAPGVEKRRQSLIPFPWTCLQQLHGAEVLVVDTPGAQNFLEADGLATVALGAVLSVQTADCAPVLFVSEGGAVGIAHAGWKGLEAGILTNTAKAVRSLADGQVWALLGPCIHACCYEFGAQDLDRLSKTFGQGVCAVDSDGHPSLDLPAAIESALSELQIELIQTVERCTEQNSFWSHRIRSQHQRMASCIWIES